MKRILATLALTTAILTATTNTADSGYDRSGGGTIYRW